MLVAMVVVMMVVVVVVVTDGNGVVSISDDNAKCVKNYEAVV